MDWRLPLSTRTLPPTQPLHSPHICAPHQNPRPTAQSPSTTLHTPGFAQRRYNEALADFKKVIDASGQSSAEPRITADAYCRIADCQYYSSDFNAAAANYDRALSANPATGDYPLFQKAVMRGLSGAHAEKNRHARPNDADLSNIRTHGISPCSKRQKASLHSTAPTKLLAYIPVSWPNIRPHHKVATDTCRWLSPRCRSDTHPTP